jgi:cellulose synthase/poly-beta-1,6-N-acetylglucosamine synthase-like glycosyltransferase
VSYPPLPSKKFEPEGKHPIEIALNGLPGGITWLALILCSFGLIFAPYPLLTVAAVLAFYSALRFTIAVHANILGISKIKQAKLINWRSYHSAHRHKLSWDDVHHLVIVPNYSEPISLLQKTLSNMALSPEAKHMTVVLAMEEREDGAEQKARQLISEFNHAFARVIYTLHPANIKGELRCKSANQNWAVRVARRILVDELDYNPDYIVVTTMDADTLWHPNYFSALTAYFATDDDRYQQMWQAPIRYHSNVYEINPLMRIVNAYATAFELAFLSAGWWLSLPMSSYSMSLRLLEASDYWDTDVIADEWHTYIKAFAATKGRVLIQPIFLPFLSQATTGKNFWHACINRYKQSLRHGWGSKELGFAIVTTNRTDAPPLNNARLIARISHDILLPSAGWIVVTLGAQLPILLHESIREQLLEAPFSSASYMLLQFAFILFTLCSVMAWWVDVKNRPERTTPRQWGETILVILGFLTLPLMTFAFVALPLFQAQTKLMFGDELAFQVTKKQAYEGDGLGENG